MTKGSTNKNIAPDNTTRAIDGLEDIGFRKRRYRPVIMASAVRKRKLAGERRVGSGGKSSGGERWMIGGRAASDVIRGMMALRRRYNLLSCGSMELAMRLYIEALTPLKLILRERASALFAGKFLMQRT